MKKTIAIAAFLIIFADFSFALEKNMQTIQGKFIDVRCYVNHGGGKEEKCRQCTIDCFKSGNPGGILEKSTGKIYIVVSKDNRINPTEELIPFFTKNIEVEGMVKESNGVYTIAVESVKEIAPSAAGIIKKNDSRLEDTSPKQKIR